MALEFHTQRTQLTFNTSEWDNRKKLIRGSVRVINVPDGLVLPFGLKCNVKKGDGSEYSEHLLLASSSDMLPPWVSGGGLVGSVRIRGSALRMTQKPLRAPEGHGETSR